MKGPGRSLHRERVCAEQWRWVEEKLLVGGHRVLVLLSFVCVNFTVTEAAPEQLAILDADTRPSAFILAIGCGLPAKPVRARDPQAGRRLDDIGRCAP